jgi:hypothetical protein
MQAVNGPTRSATLSRSWRLDQSTLYSCHTTPQPRATSLVASYSYLGSETSHHKTCGSYISPLSTPLPL